MFLFAIQMIMDGHYLEPVESLVTGNCAVRDPKCESSHSQCYGQPGVFYGFARAKKIDLVIDEYYP
jgi:hypothetical protein